VTFFVALRHESPVSYGVHTAILGVDVGKGGALVICSAAADAARRMKRVDMLLKHEIIITKERKRD
jgi:hypothetical protein